MIVYKHVQNCNQKGTLAFELPTRDDLELMYVQHCSQILIKLGYTLLHPNDRYIKKNGRELAGKRMDYFICNFTNVECRGTKHIYHLIAELASPQNPKKKIFLSFGISTITESNETRLIYGDIA